MLCVTLVSLLQLVLRSALRPALLRFSRLLKRKPVVYAMKVSVMDSVTHGFMDAFVYMDIRHFRTNACQKQKARTCRHTFAWKLVVFSFSLLLELFSFVQLYKYKTKETPPTLTALFNLNFVSLKCFA